jgi:hypothetical protein
MANLYEIQKGAMVKQAFGKLMSDYSQPVGEEESSESPQEELLCEMLEASAQAKVFHWQTSSFAEHEAMGEFYEGFNDLMDKFIESYQGCYGRIMVGCELEVKPYTMDAPIAFMTSFKEYVSGEARMLVMGNLALLNILDEIKGLTEQTLYRLTFK